MNTAQEVAADIARELRANPKAWLQDRYSNGCRGNSLDSDATAWCLSGHLKRRGHKICGPVYEAFVKHLGGYSTVCDWNDRPSRTVEEVIALCDRVAAA